MLEFIAFAALLAVLATCFIAGVLSLAAWIWWSYQAWRTRRRGRDWCEICKAPQRIMPDGEHRCVEEIPL